MPIGLTEDHRALTEVAKAVVGRLAGTAGARRLLLDPPGEQRWWETDALWKEMVATGWLGLHIDEQCGGQGFGLPELTIVLEQLGRYAIGGPFLPTVAASAVIAEVGANELRRYWLPRLTSGESVAAIVANGAAVLTNSRVSATGLAIAGEPGADLLLVPVGSDLVMVENGPWLSTRRLESTDQLVAAVTIADIDSAPVAGRMPGGALVAARTMRLLASAEAVGGLSACVQMAADYAKTREQFGRQIGSFQAVKHHCANMLIDAEFAAAATWHAAAARDNEVDLAATLAAGHALPAYERVALRNIQVHGGIAYTWEHDAHLYVRRAVILLLLAGGTGVLHDDVSRQRLDGLRPTHALELGSDAEEYRQEVRDFRAELDQTRASDQPRLWARSGYLQPHWPAPYGLDANPTRQLVIEEELRGIERPHLGLGDWVIPTLLQHGSQEQIDRLMWPSLEGGLRWCQLFSEPGAGSDAAAVATRAVPVEGGWSITGQKVWTSDAANCNRGLIAVRTGPSVPKHKGISAMIVDMAADGVEVRPLKELTGEALFNEVFFNNVFVPHKDVVGDIDGGWKVVMDTFGNERVSIGGGSVTLTAEELLPLLTLYCEDDQASARSVGALLVEDFALAALNLRSTARAVFDLGPGIEGNIAKLFGAEHAQRVAELALQLARPAVLSGTEPKVPHDYLYSRCLTLAGGTSEILRNLIAERILRLPREHVAN